MRVIKLSEGGATLSVKGNMVGYPERSSTGGFLGKLADLITKIPFFQNIAWPVENST